MARTLLRIQGPATAPRNEGPFDCQRDDVHHAGHNPEPPPCVGQIEFQRRKDSGSEQSPTTPGGNVVGHDHDHDGLQLRDPEKPSEEQSFENADDGVAENKMEHASPHERSARIGGCADGGKHESDGYHQKQLASRLGDPRGNGCRLMRPMVWSRHARKTCSLCQFRSWGSGRFSEALENRAYKPCRG